MIIKKYFRLLAILLFLFTFGCCSNAGISRPSNAIISTTLMASLPTTPSGVTLQVISSAQINLSYNASTSSGTTIAKYLIYRNGSFIGTTSGTTYYDVNGLVADTQYCYTVAAQDSNGSVSLLSSQACATTLLPIPPSMPTGLTLLINSSSQINISWVPSTDVGGPGVLGYNIYRSGAFLTSIPGTSYSDVNLAANTQYCYTISAYTTSGISSPQSATACATTLTNILAPTGVSLSVVSAVQINISWNGNGSTYLIYRNGSLIGTTLGTTYNDVGLVNNTQYCYTVASRDSYGRISLLSVQVCATTSSTPSATAFNEWYGPFSSWTNVMGFGAKCDGSTDDSIAINAALAAIGNGTCPPVLLIPGMCLTTQRLYLGNRTHIAVVGLNRDTCGFIYNGGTVSDSPVNDDGTATCFQTDGVSESYFARLTFNGNFKARTVLSSYQQPSNPFENNNLYEDIIVKNSSIDGQGIDGGNKTNGFSNSSFVRAMIISNSYGIVTRCDNSLDIWMTDCLFESNNVACDTRAGSIHTYNCFFKHNNIDIYYPYVTAFFSAVSNTSYQSGIFLETANQGVVTSSLLLKGNTVIDPSQIPYQLGGIGPVIMIGNTTLTTNKTISFTGSFGDIVAVSNTNGLLNWLSVSGGTSMRENLVNNYVVARSSLTYTLPNYPVQATNLNRTIVELTTNVTAALLQTAINNGTDGSVYHIPANVGDTVYHNINFYGSVTFPVGKDVRIVGDGQETRLVQNNPGLFFILPHPSHVTLSHLELFGYYKSEDVTVTNVGTTTARVYLRECNAQFGTVANVFLGNCPNTIVDIMGLVYNYTYDPNNGYTTATNLVLAGGGKLRFIQTDSSVNNLGLVCLNGGQAYIETSYNEANAAGGTFSNNIFHVGGNGTITYLNTKLVENDPPNTFALATKSGFAVSGLSGQLSFLNCGEFHDWFNISGTITGNIWLDGNTVWNDPQSTFAIYNSTSYTPIQNMNYNYSTTGAGGSRLTDVGTISNALTLQMLSQALTEYCDRYPMGRRTNQTDVLLDNVYLETGTKNISVNP